MNPKVEPLRVAHLNARSLNQFQKWKNLEDYITSENIDAMIITESWLNKNVGTESE